MKNQVNTEYKQVRALVRGLQILNTLNLFDGGFTSTELACKTGIHRTTVRRLLETLQQEGYVRKNISNDSFQLTMKVRELSEGFRDDQWISELAAPLLAELLQKVVWPTDICTLDGDAMVVRETTHRFSRLSFHRSMIGRRLPILTTAAGRAYFAFCPESERTELLNILASQPGKGGELARNGDYISNLIDRTRNRGYSENYAEWEDEEKIASIAIPIFQEQRVVGILNLVYIAKAMLIEEAVKKHLPNMLETVRQIQDTLSTNSPR